MKYKEIQILTTTEGADTIWYILDDEGAEGVTIEDPQDLISMSKDETKWDYIEEELISKMGDDVKVKGYFPEEAFTKEKHDVIRKRIDELTGFGLLIGKGTIIVNEILAEDWANSWKKFYKPTKIGNKIVIKPSWEAYEPQGEELIVELDPGMAFGTGTHETTSMCIILIEKYIHKDDLVYDVGCGSGILGICAAKLGARAVLCADFDEKAIKVAGINAGINNVADITDVRCGNLLDVIDKGVKAELIVANIIADVIMGFTDEVELFLKQGGVFISSGIISERKDEVLAKFAERNYTVLEIMEKGEWVAIAVTK